MGGCERSPFRESGIFTRG